MKTPTYLLFALLAAVSSPALSANPTGPGQFDDQKAKEQVKQPVQGQVKQPVQGQVKQPVQNQAKPPAQGQVKNSPKEQVKGSVKQPAKDQRPNGKTDSKAQRPQGDAGKVNDKPAAAHPEAGKALEHGQSGQKENNRPWWQFWG